jgi:hypothetical protein
MVELRFCHAVLCWPNAVNSGSFGLQIASISARCTRLIHTRTDLRMYQPDNSRSAVIQPPARNRRNP